jgi:predicted  nucleic acid-binding Zn-ribbon protein
MSAHTISLGSAVCRARMAAALASVSNKDSGSDSGSSSPNGTETAGAVDGETGGKHNVLNKVFLTGLAGITALGILYCAYNVSKSYFDKNATPLAVYQVQPASQSVIPSLPAIPSSSSVGSDSGNGSSAAPVQDTASTTPIVESASDAQLRSLEERLSGLEKDYAKDKANFESRIKEYEAKLESANAQIDSFVARFNEQSFNFNEEKQQIISDYQTRLNSLSAEFDSLETAYLEQAEQSDCIQEKLLSDYQTRLNSLGAEFDLLGEQLVAKEKEMQELRNKVAVADVALVEKDKMADKMAIQAKSDGVRLGAQSRTGRDVCLGAGIVPDSYNTWEMLKASASGRYNCVNENGRVIHYKDGCVSTSTAVVGAVARIPTRLLVDVTRKVPYLRGVVKAVDEIVGSVCYAPHSVVKGVDSLVRGEDSMQLNYAGDVSTLNDAPALNTYNPADREAGAVDATLSAVRIGAVAVGIDSLSQGHGSHSGAGAQSNPASGGISGGMSGGNEF